MNWVAFAERRPEANPKRDLLILRADGSHVVARSEQPHGWPSTFYRWSEIEPPPKPDDKCFMLEDALKRVLIAHGSYGDGGNLDKAVRKICHDALNKFKQEEALAKIPVTEEQVIQFMKECDEGKHKLSAPSQAELDKAWKKLATRLNIPPPKPDPFEAWKVRYFVAEELTEEKEVAAKAGWDAAIKHAKGEG